MTNPAYEATNSDVEKLIADMKAAAEKATPGRIGDRIDGSGSIKYECLGLDKTLFLRTDHKNMEYGFIGDNGDADEVFFRLSSPENVLALIAAMEQAKQYSKKRDEENQDLMLTIGRLRVEREQMESAPNGMMQLSNELAEMKRKCAELQEQKDKWAVWAIALGAKADELESRPLCVKSNDAMREVAPLCVKLPKLYGIDFCDRIELDEKNGFLFYSEQVIDAIRAAGGTVEGGE